jgi:hypothetical protein
MSQKADKPTAIRRSSRSLGETLARSSNLDEYALTIKDVARMWGKSTKAVQGRIDTGSFIAVKKDADYGLRGGVWLIERQSVIEIWGIPTHE